MIIKRLTPILALGLLLASAHATAEITTCAAHSGNRAIAEVYDQRWRAALNGADDGALEALYSESAVLMPPSDETLVGRAPISTYLNAAALPARASDYSVELVSCELHGTALHIAAVWATPGARDAGAGTWRSGNLLRVLEPGRDGQWVSAYEIWN